MLCQHCKMNEANTHIKSVVNGKYEEYMLCSECAKKMGYTNIFSEMQSDFPSILGSFFSNALPERSETTRCKKCGSTYHDIAKSGKVGCADCYTLFINELMPTISRIHGNTTHCGKVPAIESKIVKVSESQDNSAEIEKLREELKLAVDKQDFETAAQLRDKIREMEETK